MKTTVSKYRSLPMGYQLTLVLSVVIFLAFGLIIYTSYNKRVSSFQEEYISSNETILRMETANLEQYIRDLRSFCVQPCLNLSVYHSFLKTSELSASEKEEIKKEIQSEYHSRADLLSYSITIRNEGLCFERPYRGQHVSVEKAEDITQTPAFQACGATEKYEYLAPSSHNDAFFEYYHYLIRIRDRYPVSLSHISVDTTQLKLMADHHQKYGEFLCLYNSLGELIYSDLPSEALDRLRNDSEFFKASETGETVSIANHSYLATRQEGKDTGLVLFSLLPHKIWAEQVGSFLRPIVIQMVVISLILILVMMILIRMITVPLTRLSSQMSKMGHGDFSEFSSGGGCMETEALMISYNDMAAHINKLIETNYISSINEKNARLKALEAQLNPHFLYNTLQAIATEALMADQPEIYDMIVSLAGNLRYTIKGNEIVPLCDEMTYVGRYVLLQKTRLKDRLFVENEIDPDTANIMIPKISVQMLVENAILHGMSENGNALHITIRAAQEEGFLSLEVTDDGTGIDSEKMNEICRMLSETDSSSCKNSIGLSNLADRLRILYQGKACLSVFSEEHCFTKIQMKIPCGR